jgi:mannose-6-phosphate isomerase-like protein (cupin superfamily)
MHALHLNDAPQAQWEGFPYRTLLPAEIGGSISIYLLTVTHANPHTHETEDQIYIIHSGQGLMEIGDERQEVGPGWLIHIPHGQRHALTPLNGEPVVLYSIEYRAI